MLMAPSRKFSIQLPDWYDRRLRLWSYYKGTARATLAANIIQARIEANWQEIDQEFDRLAKDRGIARAELEAEILNEQDE